MKIQSAHIGLQVVVSDAPDATVYEITELRRDGKIVVALLKELNNPNRSQASMDVCYLQLPTIQQLLA
jgi:hypothetical protein